jgi:hypothetical protein
LNDTIFVRAQHLGFALSGTSWTGDASSQTAGNVLQLWGGTAPGLLDAKYLEGNNIQGRIVEESGVDSGANLANVHIDYGRATGAILQNSRVSRVAYDARDGTVLGDVSPTP